MWQKEPALRPSARLAHVRRPCWSHTGSARKRRVTTSPWKESGGQPGPALSLLWGHLPPPRSALVCLPLHVTLSWPHGELLCWLSPSHGCPLPLIALEPLTLGASAPLKSGMAPSAIFLSRAASAGNGHGTWWPEGLACPLVGSAHARCELHQCCGYRCGHQPMPKPPGSCGNSVTA